MSNFWVILKAVVEMLIGMGVFLFGLELMSQGLEKAAGKNIRKLFNKINNNRFVGLGIGTVATGIVQSSTAISIMVVGFVNAGVMTLFQATAIIMGANIGTTFDAFLYVLGDLDISTYLMLLAPIGFLMMSLDKKGSISRIGECLVGIGLIFVGLGFLSGSFKAPVIKVMLEKAFSALSNPFLLIFLSMIVTAIVHSSSLVTAVVISLVAEIGTLSPMGAFFIILGSNIGTCFTALIASIGANTNAKRTAFIHIFYNILGVIIFGIFMIPPPLAKYFEKFMAIIAGNNLKIQVSMFHLVFNVLSAVIFIPLIKQIVWVAEKVIPEGKSKHTGDKLKYIDERILNTPSVAVAQVMKEIVDMAHLAEINLDLSMSDVINCEDSNVNAVNKNERHINYLNRAITNYLVQISSLNISKSDEILIGALYHVVSDIERIGDHSENLSEAAQAMIAENIILSEDAKNELMTMYQKIKLLYRDALYVFEKRNEKMIDEVNRREEEIDEMKKQFANNHIERLHKGVCSVESGEVFYSVTSNLERIADHLTNVAYSIRKRQA